MQKPFSKNDGLILLLLLVYFPILSAAQPANPDASIILQNLRDFGGIVNYLSGLLHFQTIDVQPLRDLTLALDLFLGTFGLNTIVFQNLFWWMSSLLIVKRILSELLPEIPAKRLYLLTLAFGVYPLFTSSISWGMNRKHLLSFFFILLATYFWIRDTASLKWRSVLAYTLSVLSQPITLLWPVFAFIWSGRKDKKSLGPLLVIMTSVVMVNLYYYRTSEVYRFIYPPKEDPLSFPDMLLAFGHYHFQLVFPYLLSFRYTLGHWSVLWGLAIGAAFLVLSMKKIKERRWLAWIAFGVCPVLIILRDPQTLSDAYLLCPAFSLLILIARETTKIKNWMFIAWVTFSAVFTSYESSHWQSRLKLAEVTFERRPDCGGAFNYMRASYESFTKAPSEARTYVAENECYQRMHVTPFMYRSMILLSANTHFYETDLPVSERLARLKELSPQHPYAHLSLIGLLLQSGDEESARKEAEELKKWTDVKITAEYHAISAKIVHPFCLKEKIQSCLAVTSRLLKRED